MVLGSGPSDILITHTGDTRCHAMLMLVVNAAGLTMSHVCVQHGIREKDTVPVTAVTGSALSRLT
jgi:hypothetical protein